MYHEIAVLCSLYFLLYCRSFKTVRREQGLFVCFVWKGVSEEKMYLMLCCT